jgi:hypothetical protein
MIFLVYLHFVVHNDIHSFATNIFRITQYKLEKKIFFCN